VTTLFWVFVLVLILGALIAISERKQEREARRWFRREMGWEDEDG